MACELLQEAATESGQLRADHPSVISPEEQRASVSLVYSSRIWIAAVCAAVLVGLLFVDAPRLALAFAALFVTLFVTPGILVTRSRIVVPGAPWHRWSIPIGEIAHVKVIKGRTPFLSVTLEITTSNGGRVAAEHLACSGHNGARSELAALARAIEARAKEADAPWTWPTLVII